MSTIKAALFFVIVLATGLGVSDARAHCDAEDGPVANAVQKALETVT